MRDTFRLTKTDRENELRPGLGVFRVLSSKSVQRVHMPNQRHLGRVQISKVVQLDYDQCRTHHMH